MLSETRRQQLDGIVSKMVENKEADNDIQLVVDDFKRKYENESVPAAVSTEGDETMAGSAAGAINRAYDRYASKAKWSPLTLATKGLVGLAGGAIGGTVGLIGGGAKQAFHVAKGEKLDMQEWGTDIIRTAKETGKFGMETGEAGAVAAPMAILGWAPNVIAAYGQGYQGLDDLVKGVKEGDAVRATEGALALGTAATAALMVKGMAKEAIKTKSVKPITSGILVNPRVAEVIKDARPSIKRSRALRARQEAYDAYGELYNESKTLLSREMMSQNKVTKFLADEGFIPDEEGGRINNRRSIEEARERRNAQEREYQDALSNRTEKDFDLLSIEKTAIEKWNEQKNMSAKEKIAGRDAIKDYITNEIRLNAEAAGIDVSGYSDAKLRKSATRWIDGSTANQIKRGMWNDAYSKDRTQVVDEAAHAIGDAIVDDMAVKYESAPQLAEMNKRLGLYSEAIRFLSKTNGNTIKGGGLLSKWFSRIAGGAIGLSAGGPLGAGIGAKVSEMALSKITSPEVRAAVAQRKLKKAKKILGTVVEE